MEPFISAKLFNDIAHTPRSTKHKDYSCLAIAWLKPFLWMAFVAAAAAAAAAFRELQIFQIFLRAARNTCFMCQAKQLKRIFAIFNFSTKKIQKKKIGLIADRLTDWLIDWTSVNPQLLIEWLSGSGN